MSRTIAGKILAEATLMAASPIAVGGAGSGGDVDLELALDGQGRFYIPGSSLAGPLRAWVEAWVSDGGELAEALFGYQTGDSGHASWLYIEDAPITLPHGLGEELRHGIQIDRSTNTVREKFYFTRAVLPRGSTLQLNLELDMPATAVPSSSGKEYAGIDFEKTLRLLLEELCGNGLFIGAAKTRGLGKMQIPEKEMSIRRFDFSDIGTGLMAWLRDDERSLHDIASLGVRADGKGGTLESAVAKRCREHLTFDLGWKPSSPVMSKSGFDGIHVDTLPLVGGIGDDRVAPVIPGSSLKGVLRSHAARIVRTMAPKAALTNTAVPGRANPDPDSGIAIITDLFGDGERVGRLSVLDVYQAGNPVSASGWRSEGKDDMNRATTWEDHVAIDRFTGGAAEGRLYNLRAPKTDLSWEDIRITVDFERPVRPEAEAGRKASSWPRLTEKERRTETALILLVLRDLEAGMITVGFAGNRGMGEINVLSSTVNGCVAGDALSLENASPPYLSRLDKNLLESLSSTWTEALKLDPQLPVVGEVISEKLAESREEAERR